MRPLRVFHLISGLEVGGAETTLKSLVLGMREHGWDSSVVSLIDPGPIGAEIERAGIPVLTLGMTRGSPSAVGAYRLSRVLRRRRPDVLQTWLYHADLLGLAVGTALRLSAIAWNVRAADLEMARYRRLSSWTLKACAALSRFPRVIVFNSKAGQDFHESIGYRPRCARIIPNGYDCAEFRPDPASREAVRREFGIGKEDIVIGLAARLDPMKDHATFFRAAGLLKDAVPRARFFLAGEGLTAENDAVARMIDEEKLRGKVYLLGRRRDMPRIYTAFDVGTLSSKTEGFPNTVGEAMASGVPCVVTDVGDAARIVGPTGVVVTRGDPAALAAGWSRLISLGPAGLQALGDAARSRVLANYELSVIIGQYEALYRELAEGGASPCAA